MAKDNDIVLQYVEDFIAATDVYEEDPRIPEEIWGQVYVLHVDYWLYFNPDTSKPFVEIRLNPNSENIENPWIYYQMPYSYNNGSSGNIPSSEYWGGKRHIEPKHEDNEPWTIIKEDRCYTTYNGGDTITVNFKCWNNWCTLSGEVPFKLSLTTDGMAYNPTGAGYYTKNSSVPISVSIPDDDDNFEYTFGGWYDTDDETLISSSQTCEIAMPSKNLTLRATAIKTSKYKLTINVENGTINGSSSYTTSVTFGNTYTPSGNTIVCDGKTLTVVPFDDDTQYTYGDTATWNPTSVTFNDETVKQKSIRATFKKTPRGKMCLGAKKVVKYYLGGSPVTRMYLIDKDRNEYVVYESE